MDHDDSQDPIEYLARVIYSDPKLLDRFRPPAKGFIRVIREASGITRAEMASRLGMKPQSLAKIEQAEAAGVIGLDTLRRAARVLDCTVVYALIPNQSESKPDIGRREQAPKARSSKSLLVDVIVDLYFETALARGREAADMIFADLDVKPDTSEVMDLPEH
jgi:predicted DNA-binding mobile mystery protein A